MKYMKTFEAKASEYKAKYDKLFWEISDQLQDDMKEIFTRLNTDVLKPINKNGTPMILQEEYWMSTLSLDQHGNININAMYNGKDKNRSGNERDEYFTNLPIEDQIAIYEHFETFTLQTLIEVFFDDEASYDIAALYKANYEKIDLNDMYDGFSFWDLYKKDKYAFANSEPSNDNESMMNSYEFQTTIFEKHPEWVKNLNDEVVIWDEQALEDFPEQAEIIKAFDEGEAMGFFKNTEDKG